MHRRGILFLVLVVGLLYAASRYDRGLDDDERERIGEQLQQRELLVGIEAEDIADLVRVRIDNLERSVQVTMERSTDEAGRSWSLVDPIVWPAETAVLTFLFEVLERDRGQPSPDVDPADVGLDPPRALCELTFQPEGEDPTTHLVEIGSPDLDRLRLFVAVTGPDGERRVLRANRSLESIFERFEHDYRGKAILELDPSQVVEVRRRGPATLPAPGALPGGVGPTLRELPNPLLPPEPFPTLDLVLRQGVQGWEATEPYAGALDPQAAAMVVLTLSRLEATGFHAETAPDPARFGFDRPELQVDLVTADAAVHRLSFARTPGERRAFVEAGAMDPLGSEWLCMVEGRPTVFEVRSRSVMLAAGPPDAFVDARVVRGATEQVRSVTWAAGGRESRLERTDGIDATWTITGTSRDGARLEGRPADAERVGEFLQALRAIELAELLPGAGLAPSLVPEFLRVDVRGDERGGDFGPLMGGVEGMGFRRLGEALVARVDPAVGELLATPPEDFLSRRLLEVEELRMGAVELELAGEVLRFERDPRRGRWSRAGSEDEDRAFAGLVDRLRGLRALSFVLQAEGTEPAALVEPVVVTLELLAEAGPRGRPAERITYRVAEGEAGTELLQLDEQRVRIYPGLRADLGRLFVP